MTVFLPIRQATLLIPSGPPTDPDKKHLFVICTKQSPDKELLLVSISRWKATYCDSTCLLGAGDHPFIKSKSFVEYRKARIETTSTITAGIKQGVFFPKDTMDGKVFAQIMAGFEDSLFTPGKVLKFLTDSKKW